MTGNTPTATTKLNRHTLGVYAVLDPRGVAIMKTFADTGYDAHSRFVRKVAQQPWRIYAAKGYCLARLEVVEIEVEPQQLKEAP